MDLDRDAVVVLITAHSAVETAVAAMKLGAVDFVAKPWQKQKLLATLNSALQLRKSRLLFKQLAGKNRELAAQMSPSPSILGDSPPMREVFSVL